MKSFTLGAILGLLFVIPACSTQTAQKTSPPQNDTATELKSNELPSSQKLMAAMELTAAWQIPRLDRLDYITFRREQAESKGQWMMGAVYSGLIAVAERSTNPFFEDWIGFNSDRWNWQLGPKLFYADDHLIGSTYIWYYKRNKNQGALKHLIESFDKIISANPTNSLAFVAKKDPTQNFFSCQYRWCWADALYMSPPTWFELSRVTGDKKYEDYAHKEFQATINYLYSDELDLVYRDSRFFDMKGQFGEPIFWARGTGWVYGGLVRVMEALPEGHPYRPYYENLFKKMSASLKKLQKSDGSWAMSLLAGEKINAPETSGTGFFTYGMAWGVKTGLLNEAEYMPAVLKGWQVLSSAVHPDGKLGWVQGVSAEPGKVSKDDSQIYGVGAYLLAASQLYDIAKQKELGLKSDNVTSFIFEGIRDFVPQSFRKVVFYADKARGVWAVNALRKDQRVGFGRAYMQVPLSLKLKDSLKYRLTLVTLGEIDGESQYQVYCDDNLLGEFQNPRVETDYQEVEFHINHVDIAKCDRIGVASNAHTNGLIPEGDGTAFARGRWARVHVIAQ